MREITAQDLEYLAIGAAILGTGGGGDPLIGKLMARQAIEENGPVSLLDPSELADDALVMPVGIMGAPTVLFEKVPEGRETLRLLHAVEQALGRRVSATTPTECGGINSQIPFLLAAHAHLPVLDGDGMGRAFPELQMVTFHVYGASGSPAWLADERGSVVMLQTSDNMQLEWLARGVTMRMGGLAHLVDYVVTGKQYRQMAVHHTVSTCIDIGRAVLHAPEKRQYPIEVLCAATQNTLYGRGIVLFQGKIVDVVRRTEGGFARGRAVLRGLQAFQDSELLIEFQNENLVARRDGEVVACVPDLITVLDSEVATAITTERLHYGQRATVIAIPSPEILRTSEALRVWEPRAFGYDIPFVPLERRFAAYYREHGVPRGKERYL